MRESLPVLSCEVPGGIVCLLPLRDVAEVMRPLTIVPLPELPPYILGISRIRGQPTPVVDAGALFSTADTVPFRRFVSLRVDRRLVALALTQVFGIVDGDAFEYSTLPPLAQTADGRVIAGIGATDRGFALVLEAAKTLTRDAWQRLTAAAEG